MYGICKYSIVPVRSEGADKAEMVTQLMFGDVYQILAVQEKWLKVRNWYDGYEGWIDPKLHSNVGIDYYNRYQEAVHGVMISRNEELIINDIPTQVLRGSVLPFFDGKRIDLGMEKVEIDPEFVESNQVELHEIAKLYVGTPYIWGGKSPFGIDCSGLSQQVARIAGKKILRDASQQATQGQSIDRQDVQSGDLAFFNNMQGKIIHVGIMNGPKEIIHAHGFVKLSRMDDYGILVDGASDYSHHLSHIIRI